MIQENDSRQDGKRNRHNGLLTGDQIRHHDHKDQGSQDSRDNDPKQGFPRGVLIDSVQGVTSFSILWLKLNLFADAFEVDEAHDAGNGSQDAQSNPSEIHDLDESPAQRRSSVSDTGNQ